MLLRQMLVAFFAFAFACTSVLAEELTPQKRADIEQLLEMTGALALGKQMAANIIANATANIKKSRPDIPQHVVDLLPAEVMATVDENMGALKEEMIPLYHKHFSDADIKELIRFYSSDLGRRTIQSMPAVMQEAMAIGARWGQSFAPELDRRIKSVLRGQGVKI